MITDKALKRVAVDTTVMEKNIAHPTDARLYERARGLLVGLAKKAWIELRQSYARLASLLRLACGLPVHEVVGASQMQKAPRGAGRGGAINGQSGRMDSQAIDSIEELALVAGAGNHLKLRLLSAYRAFLERSALAWSRGLLRSAA